MAKKVVSVVVDDFDGKELSADTQPTKLTIDRKSYALYLSARSRKALDKALSPFLDGADAAPAAVRATRSPRNSPSQTQAVRAWAKENGILHNGKPLSDRGRIPQDVLDEYNERG